MILMMKLMSVGFDWDDMADAEKDGNLFPVISYCMDCSTVLFGPWISFKLYKEMQESPILVSIVSDKVFSRLIV